MTEVTAIVRDRVGLHARPAAALVKKASKFKSTITLETNGKKAMGSSILQVLSLAAKEGDSILIRAEGEDEVEAANVLAEVVCSEMPL